MKLTPIHLDGIILEAASERWRSATFGRTPLIEAVISRLRSTDHWEDTDNTLGNGRRRKSKGFERIDWRFVPLSRAGRLTKLARKLWQVTPPDINDVRQACDVAGPPGRVLAVVSRIIRDTPLTIRLKHAYDYRCQVCNETIELALGCRYAEVHHIRPLGGDHNGMDVHENMLVLCPNHHVIFDLGQPRFVSKNRIAIGAREYELVMNHEIADSNIDHHNRRIAQGVTRGTGGISENRASNRK